MTREATDLSVIPPNPPTEEPSYEERKKDVIDRRKEAPKNSEIWACATFKECVEKNGIVTLKEWKMSDILNMTKEDGHKYYFTDAFRGIKGNKHVMFCNLCSFSCPYFINSPSCSTMKNHIREKHSDVITVSDPKSRKQYCSFMTCDSEFQSKGNALLAAFIATGHCSFQMVNNPWLNELVTHLNSSFVLPSKTTLSQQMIPRYVDIAKNKMKSDIQGAPWICSTLDGWKTPNNGTTLYSFTVHYLFEDKLRKNVLKLSEIREEHSAANLASFIRRTIDEWSLQKFVPFIIITDNAPSVVSAVQLSGNISVRCSPHSFDLVLDAVLEKDDNYKRMTEKSKNICRKFRQTTELSQIFHNVQLEIYGSSLCLLGSVPTRFFSDYLQMERLNNVKDVLDGCANAFALTLSNCIHREVFLVSYTFTSEEESLLEFYVKVLKPFFDCSMEMSSDQTPSLSELIPSVRTLIGKYKKMITNLETDNTDFTITSPSVIIGTTTYTNFDDCQHLLRDDVEMEMSVVEQRGTLYSAKKSFLETLISELEERFFNFMKILDQDHYLISTLINPKFKLRYFDSNQKEKAKQLVRLLIGDQEINGESKYSDGVMSEDEEEFDELDEYLRERPLPDTEKFEMVLLYWEGKKSIYPNLYIIARKYLGLIASSSSSERLFSCAAQYCQKYRSRLLPSTIENECILKNYIDIYGIDELINVGEH